MKPRTNTFQNRPSTQLQQSKHCYRASRPLLSSVSCLLIAAALLKTFTLSAAPILFTDRSAFNAVTPNRSTITFEGIASPSAAVPYNDANGVTLGGVQFVGTAANGTPGQLFIESASHGVGRNWGTGDNLVGDRFGFFQSSGIPTGNIQAFLPSNTFAVSTDFMLVFTNGTRPSGPVLFNIFNGITQTDFTLNTVADAPAFAGFVSDVPITSIKYRTLGVNGNNSPYGAFDNFTIGVPEPSVATLLLFGALAMSNKRKRT